MSVNRFNFTKQALNDLPLPAAGGRDTYHDTHTGGLQLRVTSTGAKSFSLFKRAKNGSPERITLGSFSDGMTVEQARKSALHLKSDMANGVSPAAALRAKRGELSFGEAFEMYIRDHAIPHGLKTIENMRGDYERYLGKISDAPRKKHGRQRSKSAGSVDWQNKKLSMISPREIKDLRTSLAGSSGKASANHALKLVRVVFNKAIEWGEFSGTNPALSTELISIKSRDRFLQKDELPRLFDALNKSTNVNSRDFVLLSILTGARKANVLAMKWSEVDFSRNEWRIPDSKNNEPVVVQLATDAMKILHSRGGNGSDWVFPGKGKTGHMVSPKNGVTGMLRTAGIEGLRIHDLRRTLGSWQAIMGSSLAIIGKSLGHKSVTATQIYARLSADPVRHSVQRATEAIFAAGLNQDYKGSDGQ